MATKFKVRTKKYQSQGGRIVRAFQVTEKNIQGVFDWLGNRDNEWRVKNVAIQLDGRSDRFKLRVHFEGAGIRVFRPGDYLFWEIDQNGRYVGPDGLPFRTVMGLKKDLFEEKYELV